MRRTLRQRRKMKKYGQDLQEFAEKLKSALT